MNQSFHTCGWIRISGTFQFEWLLPYVIPSAYVKVYMNASRQTYEWVMHHIWVSHIIPSAYVKVHTNALRQTYERVMFHIWMSQVIPSVYAKESAKAYHLCMWKNEPSHTICVCESIYQCITSYLPHMNESCHTCGWTRISGDFLVSMATAVFHTICIYQIIHERVTSHVPHMNESHYSGGIGFSKIFPAAVATAIRHTICMYRCIHECITSHIWNSHVTYMNEPCHMYEWVMSHVWMNRIFKDIPVAVATAIRHAICMYQCIHKYIISHAWMSHVTYMSEPYHMYEWVMSHMWMNRIFKDISVLGAYGNVCINASRHACHMWTSHVTHMNESRHTCKSVEFQGSSISGDCCGTSYHLQMYTWMHHVVVPTVSTNEPRHTYEWVTLHLWISHVTHRPESRHTYKSVNVFRTFQFRRLLPYVMPLAYIKVHECVTSHISMDHVKHMNGSCHTCEHVMSHVWIDRIYRTL